MSRHHAPLVVGIGGTPTAGSSTERILRAALDAAAAAGARTLVFAGRDLDLPLYPSREPARTPAARRLVDAVARADGLIVASPAYHGTMSGAVKNALDYVEDLRGHDRPYLDGRAVGCIGCAAGWQATTTTLMSLRTVAHALRGWPTPLGVAVNTSKPTFGHDGAIADTDVLRQLELLASQVVGFGAGQRAPAHDRPHAAHRSRRGRADAPSAGMLVATPPRSRAPP